MSIPLHIEPSNQHPHASCNNTCIVKYIYAYKWQVFFAGSIYTKASERHIITDSFLGLQLQLQMWLVTHLGWVSSCVWSWVIGVLVWTDRAKGDVFFMTCPPEKPLSCTCTCTAVNCLSMWLTVFHVFILSISRTLRTTWPLLSLCPQRWPFSWLYLFLSVSSQSLRSFYVFFPSSSGPVWLPWDTFLCFLEGSSVLGIK